MKWQRTFFAIWVGQAISLLGSQLVQFSLVWYLTSKTGSASVLAMASFVALLPQVILMPVSGILIDRWNRQKVMMAADSIIAAATAVLAVLFWKGAVQNWHIYAIMFIRSAAHGFHWPSMLASTSLMVPKDQLSRIAGINQALRGILGIASPPAAALLIQSIPMQGILGLDIATAVAAILPLVFVRIPQPVRTERKEKEGLWQDFKFGLKYLYSWKGMLFLAIAAALLNFFIHPGYTFIPLLVTGHFQKGAWELSLIESAFSIGLVAGGILLSLWGGFKSRIYTILLGVLGIAAGSLVIAAAAQAQFPLALAGMAISGLMNPLTNGPLQAIIQAHTTPEVQGRIFSLLESLISLMMPVSMLVAAPVAEHIGVRGWLVVGAAGCLAIGLAGILIPSVRRIEEGAGQRA